MRLSGIFETHQFITVSFTWDRLWYRKEVKLGYSSKYNSDVIFRRNMRLLVALAVLPCEEVVELFNEIRHLIETPEIASYFENTYISGKVIRICRDGAC